ncbi:MAG: PQQ-binding-like beta-propeller repeat protein, partial [Planctomycetia bacterium]
PMGVVAGMVGWWLFFSRIPVVDRLVGVATFAAAGAAVIMLGGEAFKFDAVLLYAIPTVISAWVGWLVVSMMLAWPTRRVVLMLLLVGTWGYFGTLRVNGMDGQFKPDFDWRWEQTAEQMFLAESRSKGAAATKSVDEGPLELQAGDWPGFRGAARDGKATGVAIGADWSKTPPKELWRRRIGPGWSSFAVVGKKVFTQEQRGADELVVCYDADTGAEVWKHADTTRFTETIAGAGPRGTPTFDAGRLYTQGANGALNCLDAATGKLIWTRNVRTDADSTVPMWGFSASPLVWKGLVVTFAGGPSGKTLAAYKAETGEPAWTAGEGIQTYCSPQAVNIGGVDQILFATDLGLAAYEPETGKVLWTDSFDSNQIARVAQPAVLGNDIVYGAGLGVGTKKIRLDSENKTTKEVWTTKKFKPYYNDFVVLGTNGYGFDGDFFLCIDLDDGAVKWKTRGYDAGQVLLLADQALLLIVSEKGKIALVEAKPEAYKEIGKIQAIEGKTWNHPVAAHGRLFVRNGEEMVCYELPPAPSSPPAPESKAPSAN